MLGETCKRSAPLNAFLKLHAAQVAGGGNRTSLRSVNLISAPISDSETTQGNPQGGVQQRHPGCLNAVEREISHLRDQASELLTKTNKMPPLGGTQHDPESLQHYLRCLRFQQAL